MYHGTGTGEITAFDMSKANPSALYGPGFYFTDSSHVAGGVHDGYDRKRPDDVFDRAQWKLAGYAFQRLRHEIDQPLTKKQLAYAKRL